MSFDLQVVSVDLDSVPLDEVLQFKEEHRDAHRKYMHNLRAYTAGLNDLEAADRQRALQDRCAELQEEAHALRRRSLEAWKRPKAISGFGLGLAGVALDLASATPHANPVPGALLTALGAIVGMLPEGGQANAYTYLFKAASGPY